MEQGWWSPLPFFNSFGTGSESRSCYSGEETKRDWEKLSHWFVHDYPPSKCQSLHLNQGLSRLFSCPSLLPESCTWAGIQLWTASVVSSPSSTLGLVSPTTALPSRRPSSLGKGLPQVWSEPRKACSAHPHFSAPGYRQLCPEWQPALSLSLIISGMMES